MARPSTNILSRARIARAALARVRRTGAFTIPGIAADLGVHPSSLYHHVRGRAEIVHLMREELYAAIDLAPSRDESVPWQDRLERWMRSYRAATSQAPDVVPLLVGSSVEDARTLEIYDALFSILAAAGVAAPDRIAVSAMVDAVVLGSSVDAASPTPLWTVGDAPVPAMRAAIDAAAPVDRVEAGLELAIAAVIAALERHAAGSTTSGRGG